MMAAKMSAILNNYDYGLSKSKLKNGCNYKGYNGGVIDGVADSLLVFQKYLLLLSCCALNGIQFELSFQQSISIEDHN